MILDSPSTQPNYTLRGEIMHPIGTPMPAGEWGAGVGATPSQTTLNIPGRQLTDSDYANLISNDAGVQALRSALQAQHSARLAAARGAIQRSVLSFGEAPSQLSSYLDPGQSDLASQNQYSTMAQLGQQHKQALRNLQNQLAARGAYNSGELTYGMQNETQRYGQQQSDARGKLLDYVSGLLSDIAQQDASGQSQLASELGNATSRQLSMHPATTQATTATWNPSTGTYVDPSGNHYDASGNLIGSAGSAGVPPTSDYQAPPPPSFSYTPSDDAIMHYTNPAYQNPYQPLSTYYGSSAPAPTYSAVGQIL